MSPQTAPVTLPSRVRAPAVSFGPFEFEPNSRLLRRHGSEIPLPPRVLAVLELLLGRAGEVVSRQEIIDSVWKDAFVTDTSLAEAVSFLRQALGDDPQSPTYVQTVHRRGYRFVAPVSELSDALPAPATQATTPAHQPAVLKPSIANELLPWSIAIIAVVLAISAVWYSTRVESVAPPVVRLTLDAGPGLRFDTRAPSLAVSPTASMVAWSACNGARCQLYLRPLDALAPRPIADTEGAAAPFFSPDERWLGFFADGKLKKVAIAGGTPQILTDASQPLGAAWMPDARIVFAASAAGGLMSVSENGGEAEVITAPSAAAGEIRHVFPGSVRDGDAILFTVVTSPLESAAGRLAILPYPAGGGPWRIVAETADIGVPVGHEYIAFASGSELHAIAFDRVRQAASGADRTVATGILSPQIASAPAAFVFATRRSIADTATISPFLWNAPGEVTLASGLEQLRDSRLSPDGSKIAGVGLDPRPDVWSADLQRGTKTRLTYGGPTAAPVWRMDGSAVLFAARRSQTWEIWSRPVSPTGDERRVLAVPERHVFPSSASRSGDIAFVQTGGRTRSDIGLLRAGQSASSLVVETPFDDVAPALSPDGSLIAYQTDESGRWEIVLLRVRDGRRSPVSSGGGMRPFWSADGRTIYFERGEELMSASANATGELTGGINSVMQLDGGTPAGITAGGRILLHRTARPESSAAVVTLQWISELRAKLGPPTAASPR